MFVPTSLDRDQTRSAAELRRSSWILWGALLAGPLLLTGIALFVGPVGGRAPATEAEGAVDILPLTLGILGAFAVGNAFLLPLLIFARGKPKEASHSFEEHLNRHLIEFRTSSLVGWGLAEGGGMLGAVGILLFGLQTPAVLPLALYPFAMLALAPTQGRFAAYLRKRLEDESISTDRIERAVRNAGR